MPIRILVADDHAVVRKGVSTLLEDADDLELVGEATDGDQAMTMTSSMLPDVLLLDVTMPKMSGLDVARQVAAAYPSVRILMFSMHNNPAYILNSVKNGASGYLLKDSDHDEILKALRTVALGDLYYPPSASSVIIRHLMDAKPMRPVSVEAVVEEAPAQSVWGKLTSRETQILTCLIDGLSSRDIAERFGSSPNTVANQRASLIRKVGVNNTAELISMALRQRL
ncbi:response regulator transcription factor [Fibrella sp. HMF5335]|uniref:Response regulator transcription factor n=1 Tax=Fibrella rubiginis TaxID=2817060 RepID=A0A939K4Y6_9BACT|nr:response regulator transcription factor [Fibrella rubiginis]MBO0938904.1 response regulator transcription factor [Fibrella rubiginis]